MDEDKLETRRVRYFMQVVECGSVRGAADVLDMDPSAVSRAVAILEKDCGTRLLERRGRGVVATAAGRLLADYVRRQLSQQQHLLAELDGIEKAERGHVDVVAGEGFVDWLMRRSLREFMASHPKITIDLDVGSTDEIVARIVEERAHIGLVFQPPQDERLRSHHSHPQPILAVVPASHPLARIDRPLALADLLPYPGATLHRGYGVRQHIEAAEVSEGVRLNTQLTTSSFNAVAHFAAAGLGYVLTTGAALPVRLRSSELAALPMKNPLLHQGRVHVVTRHGRWLSPAAAELLRRIVADMDRFTASRQDATQAARA
jgi:DNA-binding transcriptional LysR family regulator